MPYSDVVGKLRHYITWRPFKCDFTENLKPMKISLAQKSANKIIRILPHFIKNRISSNHSNHLVP